MCSGILVSFRLEQSTTLDSQRHLGGHTGSLLQALLRRVSSVPERETMQTLLEDVAMIHASSPPSPQSCVSRPKMHSSCLNSNPRCTSETSSDFPPAEARDEWRGSEGGRAGGQRPVILES